VSKEEGVAIIERLIKPPPLEKGAWRDLILLPYNKKLKTRSSRAFHEYICNIG